jgi:RNA polymerase sigma-70 factor (ECF subfamily)
VSRDPSFEDLLARLRTGDDEAARRVFDQFARRLIGLARLRLDHRARGKVDAEDVVQSVFRTFFMRLQDGQFDLRDRDSLWALLVAITSHKCGRAVKQLHAQRRDVRRESAPPADDSGGGWEVFAAEPTPAEAAILAELVEQVFSGLSERERRILELHLQGHDADAIAEQVRRSTYTVQDVLKRVRRRIERLSGEAVAP